MKRVMVLAAIALFGVACGEASTSSPAAESGVISGGYDWSSTSGSGSSDDDSDSSSSYDELDSYGDTELDSDSDTNSSDDYPTYDGYDLDCSDIGHPVEVDGADPHGLDRDGDGVGCETW